MHLMKFSMPPPQRANGGTKKLN